MEAHEPTLLVFIRVMLGKGSSSFLPSASVFDTKPQPSETASNSNSVTEEEVMYAMRSETPEENC